jgi:hypothetical protein
MLRVNFLYIKNTKKKLRSKNITSFCKVISKNLEFGCKLHDPVGLVAIPDPIALDTGLAARLCHKSVIIK